MNQQLPAQDPLHAPDHDGDEQHANPGHDSQQDNDVMPQRPEPDPV